MTRITRRRRSRRKTRSPKKSPNKIVIEKIEIFIKKMTGDLLLLEVSSHDSVLSLKRQISEMCENNENDENIKLFRSNNGDELMNDKTIDHYKIENDDVLFMFVETKTPFENKRWIYLKGKNLDDEFDPKNYNKFRQKIINPPYITYNHFQGFQGKIEDFFVNHRITKSIAEKNFREFRERIPGEMKYMYAYATYYIHFNNVIDYFIATNSDCSILYENKRNQVTIYIRGYFIRLSLWQALYDDELKKLLTDDNFLVRVIKNPWVYVRRKQEEEKAEIKRKKKSVIRIPKSTRRTSLAKSKRTSMTKSKRRVKSKRRALLPKL